MTELAYAKINLNLFITGQREDGYHLLSTVMQTIDICDRITVEKTTEGILLDVPEHIPSGPENTVYKACKMMMEKYSLNGGYKISIDKSIPVMAGLGGPSTDAAATIRAINKIENLGLSLEEMRAIGCKIGADVPFLISGGRYLCEGIGEILSKVDRNDPPYVLIVKPPVSVSTVWAYTEFDKNYGFTPLEQVKPYGNDLEPIVVGAHPLVGEIIDALSRQGAAHSAMSGSGSAVFGLFNEKNMMDIAKEYIEKNYPDAKCFAVTTIEPSL